MAITKEWLVSEAKKGTKLKPKDLNSLQQQLAAHSNPEQLLTEVVYDVLKNKPYAEYKVNTLKQFLAALNEKKPHKTVTIDDIETEFWVAIYRKDQSLAECLGAVTEFQKDLAKRSYTYFEENDALTAITKLRESLGDELASTIAVDIMSDYYLKVDPSKAALGMIGGGVTFDGQQVQGLLNQPVIDALRNDDVLRSIFQRAIAESLKKKGAPMRSLMESALFSLVPDKYSELNHDDARFVTETIVTAGLIALKEHNENLETLADLLNQRPKLKRFSPAPTFVDFVLAYGSESQRDELFESMQVVRMPVNLTSATNFTLKHGHAENLPYLLEKLNPNQAALENIIAQLKRRKDPSRDIMKYAVVSGFLDNATNQNGELAVRANLEARVYNGADAFFQSLLNVELQGTVINNDYLEQILTTVSEFEGVPLDSTYAIIVEQYYRNQPEEGKKSRLQLTVDMIRADNQFDPATFPSVSKLLMAYLEHEPGLVAGTHTLAAFNFVMLYEPVDKIVGLINDKAYLYYNSEGGVELASQELMKLLTILGRPENKEGKKELRQTLVDNAHKLLGIELQEGETLVDKLQGQDEIKGLTAKTREKLTFSLTAAEADLSTMETIRRPSKPPSQQGKSVV